jgi:GntR family transcriptional regulator
LPNLSTASLSNRAFDALVEAIVTGSFAGGRLPSEPELARRLGVSRTTVRSALQSLEQVGIIDRRPGRGTHVRQHVQPEVLLLHGLVAFSTFLRERGNAVTSTVTVTRHSGCSSEMSSRLLCDSMSEGYEINIFLAADGEPAVHIRERFCGCVLTAPLNDDVAPDSVLKLSSTHFRTPIDHALATLHPALATTTERASIGVEPGRPILCMEETLYSADNEPLVLSEIAVNPAHVQYAVMRRIGD